MKTHRFLLVGMLAVALAAWAAPTLATPTETTTASFTITSPEYGNATFEIVNPEVGDIQEFWTDSSEKVTVSYDEEGFLIEIGDEELRVATHLDGLHMLPDGANGIVFEGEDEYQIMLDGEGGDGHTMIWHSAGEGEADGEPKVRIIKRHGTDVEILEDGESKLIKIPGGEDIKVLRTKDEDGKVQVKVLRNGEEIDPEELGEGVHGRMIKLGEGGPHGVHVIKIGEGEEGPHGEHVVKVHAGEGQGGHREVHIRKQMTEGGEGQPQVVVIREIENTEGGGSGSSSGTQIRVQIRKTIEDDE